VLVSVVAAFVSAWIFAVVTNLQREAAARVSAEGTGPMHLVRRLVADPRWLVTAPLGAVAVFLHGLALARGSILVVQSVIALGLVAALVLEARRSGRPLHRNELAGAALVMAGVVAVVATGRPPHGGAPAGGWVVPVCAAVVAVTVLAVRRSRHAVSSVVQARVLGAAAGACFAVDAVFLQRLATTVDGGLLTGLTGLLAGLAADPAAVAVDVVGFLGAGFVGGVAVHRAYQVAPLRSVQPAMAAAEPVTAFLIGAVLLSEGVYGGGWGYAVLIAGLLALTAGILVGLAAARPEGEGSAQRDDRLQGGGGQADRVTVAVPVPLPGEVRRLGLPRVPAPRLEGGDRADGAPVPVLEERHEPFGRGVPERLHPPAGAHARHRVPEHPADEAVRRPRGPAHRRARAGDPHGLGGGPVVAGGGHRPEHARHRVEPVVVGG